MEAWAAVEAHLRDLLRMQGGERIDGIGHNVLVQGVRVHLAKLYKRPPAAAS